MNNRKPILSIVFCLWALFSFAQNNRVEPLQTSNSIGALFPELNGWHGGLQINGYSQLWFTGFEGRPEEYLIHGDVYIPKTKSSIGVIINQDILGQLRWSLIGLNYTHRITIGEVNVLPSVGYQRNHFASLQSSKITGNQLNAGLGIIYANWFGAFHYTGYSNLEGANLSKPIGGTAWSTAWNELSRYSIVFGRSTEWKDWTFHKNIMIGTNLSSAQIDLNFNVAYKRLMAGTSYSFANAIKFGFGYDILDRYRISYSSLISLSRIRRGTNGTHELALRILLNSKTDHRILKNFALF